LPFDLLVHTLIARLSEDRANGNAIKVVKLYRLANQCTQNRLSRWCRVQQRNGLGWFIELSGSWRRWTTTWLLAQRFTRKSNLCIGWSNPFKPVLVRM